MKRCFAFFLSILFLMPGSAFAFLSGSDPTNVFSILAKAPWVLTVKVESTQQPSGKQMYFLQALKVEEVLSGRLSEAKITTLQEVLLPQDRSAFAEGKSSMVALDVLPHYTAYAAARERGAAYRMLGGNVGVVLLDEEGKELLAWSRKLFQAKGEATLSAEAYKNLLLEAFSLQSPRWVNQAALALGEISVPKNFFSAADVARIVALLQDARLMPAGQIALVQALKRGAVGPSLEALQKLADGPPSTVKWAAIRALEDLGVKRSLARLKEDFQASDEAGKLKALAAVVRQRDPDSSSFLRQVLNGSEPLAVKREAIDSMARIGGEENEAILIDQLGNKDPQVAAKASLALGRTQSVSAVPKLIQLMDSSSPDLRSAAIMALHQSNDPRAKAALEAKFPGGGEGHLH